MKKSEILKLCVIILVLIGIIVPVIIFTTNKDLEQPDDKTEEQQQAEEEQLISRLENELGARIATENSNFADISIDEITTNQDEIIYYKGVMANDENMYVVLKTSSLEVLRDANLYFSSKYPVYQQFSFNNDIYVFLHNNFNDTTYNDLINACIESDRDSIDSEAMPSDTVGRLNETTKIIIKSGSGILGEIDDSEVLRDILSSVSSARMYGDHFNCDGHAFDMEMYNEKNELIDTIYFWLDGKRLMPKSLEGGCSYYAVSSNDIDFRRFIESETDYVFYTISDYSDECVGEAEAIYEDEDYIYYLACENSDEVFIEFNLSNQKMTLEYALNNNYITPQQLTSYNWLLISEEK